MSVNNIKCNIATIDKDNSIDFVVCDKLGLWLSENSKRDINKRRWINVYDVKSLANLHQIIGYAKYTYRNHIILYRGENKLYNNVMPSAYRKIWGEKKQNEIWKKILEDIKFLIKRDERRNKIKFKELNDEWKKQMVAEGIIQHYIGRTTCLDLVDNVWTALWFGYHEYKESKRYESGRYVTYVPRYKGDESNKYQYIILFAVENKVDIKLDIRKEPATNYVIDLREVLPSIFIRPHAQHAWLLRANKRIITAENNYANNVVGVLRIETRVVREWLGNGNLMSMDNLFPAPVLDYGYDILLKWDMELNKNDGKKWDGNMIRYYNI